MQVSKESLFSPDSTATMLHKFTSFPEGYSEPCQISKMKQFCENTAKSSVQLKAVNSFQKKLHLYVWQGSEFFSGCMTDGHCKHTCCFQ